MRILSAVSLRFPEEGSSAQGQSGPNARPKGVADGYPVNIPELPERRYHDGGTQEATRARCWISWFRPVGRSARKIRRVIILRGHVKARKGYKVADATLPRKASKESFGYPYRKPTQVGEEKILRRKREPSFRNSAT